MIFAFLLLSLVAVAQPAKALLILGRVAVVRDDGAFRLDKAVSWFRLWGLAVDAVILRDVLLEKEVVCRMLFSGQEPGKAIDVSCRFAARPEEDISRWLLGSGLALENCEETREHFGTCE
jgi:hypothetical protein